MCDVAVADACQLAGNSEAKHFQSAKASWDGRLLRRDRRFVLSIYRFGLHVCLHFSSAGCQDAPGLLRRQRLLGRLKVHSGEIAAAAEVGRRAGAASGRKAPQKRGKVRKERLTNRAPPI